MKSAGIINGKQHSEIQQFLIKRFSDIEFYKRDGQFFIVKDLTDYDNDAVDTSEKYEVFENPETSDDISLILLTGILNTMMFGYLITRKRLRNA